jgi:hypothetical protein
LIALGITPGLRSLAYAVVGFYGEDRADLIDADVLRGARSVDPTSNWAALLIKGRPHRLILSVVFERNPPAVLGLGPAFSKKEPKIHVDAVRAVCSVLAQAFSVPTVSIPDRRSLIQGFHPDRVLRNIALAHVRAESLRDNPQLLLATVTATAAAKKVLNDR